MRDEESTDGIPYRDAYRDARVLVTGGAGFIGSHLVRRLCGLGAHPRVIDDLSTGRAENLPADGAVDLRVASILDDAALAAAVEGCRVVFHLAAMVSVPLSVEQPLRCAQINIEGTARVLDAARASGCRRIVFVSSAAVYGDPVRLPSREDDVIDCRSPYAASKAAGEALVAAYGRCYELSTVSLRFFNVFGPRQDPHSAYAAAIVAFQTALAAGVRPTVYGDGLQSRDFVHVDNIVHAKLLAGAHERPLRGEVYNVGTGKATSLRETLAVMNRVGGTSLEPIEAAARAGDVRHSAADITPAREDLGYEVRVGFEEGIRDLSAEGSRSAPPSSPEP